MAVLSAPASPEEIHILSSVIFVVSIFSALGAGWIIASFSVSKKMNEKSNQPV